MKIAQPMKLAPVNNNNIMNIRAARTLLAWICLLLMPVTLPAHTISTATGHTVSHSHPAGCTTVACSSNSFLESYPYYFSSSHRKYSSTPLWNCHGRTFDNRSSWVPYADPYLDYDSNVCPASPAIGDTIIWWNDDGVNTKHSATIVGSWNGTSTLIMSKYGSLGQYRHALIEAIEVYGHYWSVIRFTGGTAIYSGLRAPANHNHKAPSASVAAFLEERKRMPWYSSVLASEIAYAIEHPRQVAHSANLRDYTVQKLRTTEDETERLRLLFDDLQDPAHYEVFSLYNHPSFAEPFVTEVEAGKLLALMASKTPEMNEHITDGLLELALSTDKRPHLDPLRGTAVYFLSQIASSERQFALKQQISLSLSSSKPKALETDAEAHLPTYVDYYLQRMATQQ